MRFNKKELLSFKEKNDDSICTNVGKFLDYINDNDLTEYTEESIKNNTDVNTLLSDELKQFNWASVKYMLEDVKDANQDYLFMDGYGNFRNVTNKDINDIIDEIVTDLEKNKQEEYEL